MLSSAETDAVQVSLLVSLTAVGCSLPAGIAMGWLLARKQFHGKILLETLINLPLVLPPVVTGYLLLVSCGRTGMIGRFLESQFGLRLVFDWKGAALAAAVISFPLMVRAIRIAFSSVDVRLEQTARTLGAGRLDTFLTVTLPLAWHGIIAGSVLAFARSLGEFGATVMIAGSIPGETRTIPLFIYSLLETPGGMVAARKIVIVAVVLAAAALLLGEYLDRRGKSRMPAV